MQIKTTMKYHLTPVRKAIIIKSTNNKCCRRCGQKEPSCTVGGNATGTAPMKNSVEVPQKIKNGTAL